ncbi:MAG: hypothetical protein ACAI35_23550 [Candidatus Methylacidiphilales bacterium]
MPDLFALLPGDMFRPVGYILALVACIQIMGGHWAALQVVAWAGMIVDHSSRGETISSALGKTFDGEHPCALCNTVKSGQEKEQKDQKQLQLKQNLKLEFPLCPALRIVLPESDAHRHAPSTDMFCVARQAVPLRLPPRSV